MAVKRPKLVREEEKLNSYPSFQEVAEAVAKFKNLKDPYVDLDIETYYDCTTVKLVFSGFRDETEEERLERLAKARAEKAKSAELQKAAEAKQQRDELALLDKLMKKHGVRS